MNTQSALEYERAINRKALELLGGCSPYHNIHPTMEVVRAAWALGYDVVKKPLAAEEKQR